MIEKSHSEEELFKRNSEYSNNYKKADETHKGENLVQNSFKHRDWNAKIRHPQLDDERLKRKLEEVDNRNIDRDFLDKTKTRVDFDDYMFKKQQSLINKYHMEKQQLGIINVVHLVHEHFIAT